MWILPIRVTRPVYNVDKIVFIFHYLSITLMETDGFWEILTWLFYKVTKCSQIGLYTVPDLGLGTLGTCPGASTRKGLHKSRY